MSSPDTPKPFRLEPDEKIAVDPEKIKKEAERAARKLVVLNPQFTEAELGVVIINDDSIELRRKILSWDMGVDDGTSLVDQVAHAKEYLNRLDSGIV